MSSFKFENLHVMNLPIVDMEAEGGADYVESLDSSRAGIYRQHVVMRVTHDLEDMRMAAYEDVGAVGMYEFARPYVVTAGIASDVGDEDSSALADEEAVQRLGVAEVIVVAVAGDAHQGLEPAYLLSKGQTAPEVPRMPDFIDRLKELPYPLVKHSVCI